MTDYHDLTDAIAQVIEDQDGNTECGVPFVLPAAAYAAYAYLNNYTAADLEDFHSDAEDAYQGEYGSHEDFAEDIAIQLDMIGHGASWPNNHIDWEAAAVDLMMDYSEHDRYYFRD